MREKRSAARLRLDDYRRMVTAGWKEIPAGNREALERAVAARRAARPYRYSSAPGPTGSPASIQTTSISDQQARKTTV